MENDLSNILYNPLLKGTTYTHYINQCKGKIKIKGNRGSLHCIWQMLAFTEDFWYIYNLLSNYSLTFFEPLSYHSGSAS